MLVLHLKGVVARVRSITIHVELTGKLWIRLVVDVMAHELATGRADIGER